MVCVTPTYTSQSRKCATSAVLVARGDRRKACDRRPHLRARHTTHSLTKCRSPPQHSRSRSYSTPAAPRPCGRQLVASGNLRRDVASSPPRRTITTEARYLVWEEGFGVRFAGTAVLLAAVAFGASRSTSAWLIGMEMQGRVQATLQMFAHRLELWSLLGLLSSSCCALQLFLNLFSVGCAGFNTFLGPIRPYLPRAHARHPGGGVAAGPHASGLRLRRRTGRQFLCLLLAALPEAVHLWVHRADGVGAVTAEDEELRLKVTGMGCTACSVKVKGALEGLDGVNACTVDFEAGEAVMRVGGNGGNRLMKRARKAVKEAGFGVD